MLPPMVSRSDVKSVSSGASDQICHCYRPCIHEHMRLSHMHAHTHTHKAQATRNSGSMISDLLETRAGGMVQTLSPVSGSYQYLRLLNQCFHHAIDFLCEFQLCLQEAPSSGKKQTIPASARPVSLPCSGLKPTDGTKI